MGEEQTEKKQEYLAWLATGIIVFLLSLLFRDVYILEIGPELLGVKMIGRSALLGFAAISGVWVLFWTIVAGLVGFIVAVIFRYPFKSLFALRCLEVALILELISIFERFLFFYV